MAGLERDTAIIVGLSEANKGEFENEEKFQVVVPDVGPSSEDTLNEPDGIHDGLVFPTDEERVTLRRVSDRVPWNAYRQYSGISLFHVLSADHQSSGSQ